MGRSMEYTEGKMLEQILDRLAQVLKNQETIMSGLTDLQAVVVKIQADVQTAIAAMANQDPDAAVETAAQTLQAIDAALAAALPAPAPAPATTAASAVKKA